MTTRLDALMVPASLVSVAFVVCVIWLASVGGLIGSDSGPLSILIWPMIAGAALFATVVPMGVGLFVRRALRRLVEVRGESSFTRNDTH